MFRSLVNVHVCLRDVSYRTFHSLVKLVHARIFPQQTITFPVKPFNPELTVQHPVVVHDPCLPLMVPQKKKNKKAKLRGRGSARRVGILGTCIFCAAIQPSTENLATRRSWLARSQVDGALDFGHDLNRVPCEAIINVVYGMDRGGALIAQYYRSVISYTDRQISFELESQANNHISGKAL